MTLNTKQQEAATYMDGPALILAGPGTGKTTTLVGHYGHILASGVDPKEIICSTFNAKAAQELKDRIGQQTDLVLRSRADNDQVMNLMIRVIENNLELLTGPYPNLAW